MDEQQDGIGWNSKRIQNEVAASHYNDGRSKSHVGFVNPMHFLHATTPDNQHLAQIVNQAGQLDKEKLSKEGQSPFFRVDDGKIVGVITETDQFISVHIDENESKRSDGIFDIPIINTSDYNIADTEINTRLKDDPDREKYVKYRFIL